MKTKPPGDIRCFCNLPQCIAKGYMCKSEDGGCFSDLEEYPDVYTARHGCLEMLDRLQQEQCHWPGASPSHPQVLWCCNKDMCNHVDSPQSFRFNSSGNRLFFSGAPHNPIGYNSNEIWFKAATIAVPICGALILFVLIALAIKILRRDSLEQSYKHEDRKASQCEKKVPLLLLHDKNETNLSKPHSNLYHNVNLQPQSLIAEQVNVRWVGP